MTPASGDSARKERGTFARLQAEGYWWVTANGTITITKYTGPGGDVTIPSEINGLPVTSIGPCAFMECTSLTSVTMPNSFTSIGSYAFNACTSLTNVTIGNSVTIIEEGAFLNTSLTSLTIPNSVSSIGGGAFAGTRLTSVTIPNSVGMISEGAFSTCTSLNVITVDVFNSAYSSVDGVLFNKNQTRLIQCPGGKAGSYTVPNDVTNLVDSAFYGCLLLTNVTMPNSVTSIGFGAFNMCTSLTSITIPNSVTSIGGGRSLGAPASREPISKALPPLVVQMFSMVQPLPSTTSPAPLDGAQPLVAAQQPHGCFHILSS